MQILAEERFADNDKSIAYTLLRKNVKNINLRIKFDGTVLVSAHPFVKTKDIDNFVLRKKNYVIKHLNMFAELRNTIPSEKQYINGESFYLLGQHLRLKIFESENQKIEHDGVFLKLYVKDIQNYSKKKRIITKFFDEQCLNHFTKIMNDLYPAFEKYKVPYPILKIRTMSARWGSCSPQKKTIILNKKLIEVPKNCIEYVVLHELVHFLHPNHSKHFYTTVKTFMPDWKDRKEQLESFRLYNY